MFVRELQEGAQVECVLIVREAELRSKRDGSQFLRLTLGDRTGSLPANVWDDVAAAAQLATVGAPVLVHPDNGHLLRAQLDHLDVRFALASGTEALILCR